MNGGGVFLTKNILSKTKQGLVIGILFCSGVNSIKAITTNEVTYNNNGVEENLTETLDTLYTELKGYKTGGNVTPNEMLEGSSGYSKGVLIEGSIKKKEATTYIPGVNDITLSKGQYLNGNQIILGDTNLKSENIKAGVSLFGIEGTYTSDATATSNNLLEGETCYANGEKIEGSLPNKSGLTVEASDITSDSKYTYLSIPESGYYDTSSTLKIMNEIMGTSNTLNKFKLMGARANQNHTITNTIPEDCQKGVLLYATATDWHNRVEPNINGSGIERLEFVLGPSANSGGANFRPGLDAWIYNIVAVPGESITVSTTLSTSSASMLILIY